MQYYILVADAVRGLLKSATNPQVEDKMKCWIRQARDRDGGRKRRFEASLSRKLPLVTVESAPTGTNSHDSDSDTV